MTRRQAETVRAGKMAGRDELAVESPAPGEKKKLTHRHIEIFGVLK